ncbi:hypothetical protein RHO12_03390 [Orbus sturtevantii]|uniref:hypothetical protein n=1 Tax=Orbus sturtevantii TaxID=3074109 RepID=UPI00370D5884
MTKVSSQFLHDTIPQSRDCGCARCQMLEVKIEQLQKRMQGWDKAINEVKIEALEELITKQTISVFDIEKRIEELKSNEQI